jgi:hypothetical protein
VIAFANSYGLRGTSVRSLALEVLTTVLDHEPVPAEPWRPAPPADADVAQVCGRWWWMGREYEVLADGPGLLMRQVTAPDKPPWRFVRESRDRWRGTSGMNTGEVLSVLRGPDGAVERLDIATFVFSRDPMHLA